MSIVFDIETGSLPDDQLFAIAGDFIAPPHPGEFDPATVKYGNAKDPALRKAKEDEARTKHDAAVRNYLADTAAAEVAWRQSIRDKAALDPTTGRILAIGYLGINEQTGERKARVDSINEATTEAALLSNFWTLWRKSLASGRRFIGHNIFGFDYPFVIRRSWILGVDVPADALDRNKLRSISLCTMEYWQCGQYRGGGCESSLGYVARVLGAGEKNGNGADFARLWLSGDETLRAEALAYLLNDLDVTANVASKMGVLV